MSLTEKISKQNIEIYNDTLTYLDNGTVGPGADRIKIADSRAALETRLDDPDMSELQRDTLVFQHFVAEMNHVANRSTLPEERNEEIGRAMASELLAIRGDSDKLKGKMDAFLSPDKVKPFGWSSIDRALEESKFEKLVDIIADDTAMNYNALGIVIERAAVQSVNRVNARVLAGMGLLTNKSKRDTAEGLTTRATLNMVHTGNNWITAWEETTKDASTSGVGAALTQAQIDELGLKFFADPANDPWMTANAMRVGDVPTSEIALYIKDSINSDAPGSLTVDKNGDFVPYKEEIKVIESIAGLTGSTDDVAKVVADVKIPSPPTYGMMGPEGENWAIASIAKMIEIPGFATVINTSTPAQIAGIIKVALGASMEVKIGDSDSALAAAFALKNQLDKADVSTPDLAKAWLAEARKELAVPMQKLGSEVIQGQIFNATGYFSKQESMRDLDREKYVAQRDPNGEIDQGMTYALNNPEVFPTSFMYETRDMSLEEVVNAATEQGLKFEAELDTNDKITGGNFKIDPEWIKDKKETVAWSITSNTRAETGITMGDANVFVEKKTATSMRESAQRIAKNNSDDLTAQSTSRVLNLLAGPEKGGGPDLQAIRDLLRSKDEAEATDKMILKLLISGDTMEIPARKIIALTTIAEQNPAVLRELLKAPGKLSIFGGISRGVDKDPDGNWTVRMGKFSDDLFRSRANLTGFNGVRPGHIWADTVARNREMDEKEKTEVHNTLFDLGDIS